jgi:formamidopyrimidine-DNA glycosylase
MPELPDVERFKQYLDATALHQEVAAVEVRDAELLETVSARRIRSQLEGRSFESTSRRGKFLFVHPKSPPLLVLHFGMTGHLDYARDEREPPQHTRLRFRFVNGYWLAYVCQRKLGLVTLADDADTFAERRDLGPDALDERLSARQFCARLSGRRGAVKSALMNQAVVAGVGNVYADEILYQLGIMPGRRVDELDAETARKLYRTMRRVLKTSVRRNADVSRLPRTYLLPHRDGDGRCPRCGGELQKARISGRGTWYCPRCQQ